LPNDGHAAKLLATKYKGSVLYLLTSLWVAYVKATTPWKKLLVFFESGKALTRWTDRDDGRGGDQTIITPSIVVI
jgi:hypothetical protein